MPLQHNQAARLAGLQPAGTGGDLASVRAAGLRYAPAATSGLAIAPDPLIEEVDHLNRADHEHCLGTHAAPIFGKDHNRMYELGPLEVRLWPYPDSITIAER